MTKSNEIVIKADRYFTATRLMQCMATNCVYNAANADTTPRAANCRLKETSVNADGVCTDFKVKDDNS